MPPFLPQALPARGGARCLRFFAPSQRTIQLPTVGVAYNVYQPGLHPTISTSVHSSLFSFPSPLIVALGRCSHYSFISDNSVQRCEPYGLACRRLGVTDHPAFPTHTPTPTPAPRVGSNGQHGRTKTFYHDARDGGLSFLATGVIPSAQNNNSSACHYSAVRARAALCAGAGGFTASTRQRVSHHSSCYTLCVASLSCLCLFLPLALPFCAQTRQNTHAVLLLLCLPACSLCSWLPSHMPASHCACAHCLCKHFIPL